MLSWKVIGRFVFLLLEFPRKPVVRGVLFLFPKESDAVLKRCVGSASLLFGIFEHLLVFQKFSITFKTFLLRSFEPDWSSVNLFLQSACHLFYCCLLYQSLVGDVLSWLVVIWALKSSLRNVGGDISFKRLYRNCYGKFSTSFVPTCKIIFSVSCGLLKWD